MTERLFLVMAGLPGTGKSALARELGERLGATVLDKDRIRPALLPIGRAVYREAENDFVVGAMIGAAALLLARNAAKPVILDGRTFAQRSQIEELFAAAQAYGLEPFVVRCVCDPRVAKKRIVWDRVHPAADRGPELYDRLARSADPLPEAGLVIDTAASSISTAAGLVIARLRGQRQSSYPAAPAAAAARANARRTDGN